MAVTWDVKTKPIDGMKDYVTVDAVATDDQNPDNPITVHIKNALIGNAAQEKKLGDSLYKFYQEKKAAVPVTTEELDTRIKQDLEARK